MSYVSYLMVSRDSFGCEDVTGIRPRTKLNIKGAYGWGCGHTPSGTVMYSL